MSIHHTARSGLTSSPVMRTPSTADMMGPRCGKGVLLSLGCRGCKVHKGRLCTEGDGGQRISGCDGRPTCYMIGLFRSATAPAGVWSVPRGCKVCPVSDPSCPFSPGGADHRAAVSQPALPCKTDAGGPVTSVTSTPCCCCRCRAPPAPPTPHPSLSARQAGRRYHKQQQQQQARDEGRGGGILRRRRCSRRLLCSPAHLGGRSL